LKQPKQKKVMIDDKMKERVEKWLDSLNEQEKNQVEVLDAYFMFRTNMPGDDPGYGKAMPDRKTTEDIMDDIIPMIQVDKMVVVGYMKSHGYGFTTLHDGSVRWAIWRYMDITC